MNVHFWIVHVLPVYPFYVYAQHSPYEYYNSPITIYYSIGGFYIYIFIGIWIGTFEKYIYAISG